MADETEDIHVPDDEPISIEPDADDEAPISLAEGGPSGARAVRALGGASAADKRTSKFSRSLNVTGQGATRCRIFRSKIAIASLDFMENQINEWLDSDQIEIKHVGHVIGTMEGKRPEPNLIVTVWY